MCSNKNVSYFSAAAIDFTYLDYFTCPDTWQVALGRRCSDNGGLARKHQGGCSSYLYQSPIKGPPNNRSVHVIRSMLYRDSPGCLDNLTNGCLTK